MLHVAKTSLSSCCMGFRQGLRSTEAEKKASPPPHHLFRKHQDLLSRGSSQPPHFKSLPAPPPHRFGRIFAFPIPCLVSDKMYSICLFMQLRNIKRGGYACFQPSLPYFALKVCFFPPYFCSEPVFDTLSTSVHSTVGTLKHVSSFQKQLWVCINITS